MPVSDHKFLAYFDADDKKERCGFVLEGNRVIEVRNVHPQPEQAVEWDPESIVRHEPRIKGTWHSHPNGASTLSGQDHSCFLTWPHLQHYIVSLEGVRCYVVKNGVVLNVT